LGYRVWSGTSQAGYWIVIDGNLSFRVVNHREIERRIFQNVQKNEKTKKPWKELLSQTSSSISQFFQFLQCKQTSKSERDMV
jgi:hypothetical protein